MARPVLAVLALAHSAAAHLNGLTGFADDRVDAARFPTGVFAGVIGAAAGDNFDDGYNACVTADAIISDCYSSGLAEATAAVDEADRCFCCESAAPISSVYSVCASYAMDGSPDASIVYQAFTEMYEICSSVGGDICTGGRGPAATATTRTSPTRSSSLEAADITIPPACSSMMEVYSSCYSELGGFQTVGARDAASCFCYDASGEFNTVFEDYAGSCASWARTADTPDYPVITRLATLCDDYAAPISTSALVFTTVSGRTSGGSGGFALPSSTSSPTTQTTGRANTGSGADAGTTSSSTALAVPGAVVPGFLAWFANLATFVLSFFILI
ncbi:hypothetical protein C8A03DRAFT_41610 [Achaetomium macrosporum]|uniref:Uncharacterized protein n=1 Tax=Achaetomium macrosporum TaxID=79813 RepID=A0AAN7CF20_9PEZI|nr:hypothetical protein C8A03DRAFT_41610 [Achaetomium macrosporum]